MSDGSGPPAAAAPLRVEGRVLAGALEMRHDGTAGRGYYIAARAAIPAGANLLQEAPLAAGLAGAALPRVCRGCLEELSPKLLASPLPCPKCRRVHYCSQRCVADDAKLHTGSGECHLLRDLAAWSQLGGFLREAACATRLLAAAPQTPPLHSNVAALTDAASVSGTEAKMLVCAAELVAGARAAAAAEAATAAAAGVAPAAGADSKADGQPAESQQTAVTDGHATGSTAGVQPGSSSGGSSAEAPEAAGGGSARLQEALEAVCTVVTNGLEVLQEEGVLGYSSAGLPPPPAASVYRLTSRLNHSCRPNATYHFRPGSARVAVRSLRPIAAGEEVTICYTDVLQPAHLRRAALAERFCFTCSCPRCQEGGAADAGDGFLGGAGSRGAATEAALASAVDRGTVLFLEQGDTGACCAVLLDALAAAAATGASPLHHRALEAHCCLASACRVAARRRRGGTDLRGGGGGGGNAKAAAADSPGAASQRPAAAMALQATAAAHALVLAAALQRLVSAGEAGVVPQCGKQWSEAAGLLCELLVLHPPPASEAPVSPERAPAAAQSAAVSGGGSGGGGGLALGHMQPWPGFSDAVFAAWRQLLRLAAVQPGAAAGDDMAPPASKRQRLSGSADGIPDATLGEDAARNAAQVAVLQSAGTAAGLPAADDNASDITEAPEGAAAMRAATDGLAAAAAQCMELAAQHLKAAFGDSHPATETNAFLPFAAGLPFRLAASIVQRGSAPHRN